MGTIGKGGYRVVYSCHRSARVLLYCIINNSVKFSLLYLSLTPSIDQGYSLVNFGVMLEDIKEEVYDAYCSAVLYSTGEQHSFYGDAF